MKIKIEDYGMFGEGVGKVDGKVFLVPNALVGEEVETEIEEDFGNYAKTKKGEILNFSKERVKPICELCNNCGGCELQHMSYDEQLKFKTKLVQKTLKKVAGIDVEVKPTVCSQQFNYRNKMSFSVDANVCGLKHRKSDNILNLEECHLASENINKVLKIFKHSEIENNSHIKNLVIRAIDEQILVGVVVEQKLELDRFYLKLKEEFKSIGLYQIINKRKDSVVLDGKVEHVGGIKEIEINNFGLTYSVDLIGFHQTNIEIQNKIYQKVLTYVSDNDVVVNGFSGQGLLSAVLAKRAKTVIGIEINKNSHISAEKLKHDNQITNMTNICGDFHKHIKQIKKANTIVLDPTKKGCGVQVMNEIKKFENIIYISCNPIALAKDLKHVLDEYIIEEVTPFDMFPNTISVETVVKLKKKENK